MKLIDIQEKHLKTIHSWEQDETFRFLVGSSKARSFDEVVSSYKAYFAGEKPRLLIKGIEENGELVGKIELYSLDEQNFIGIVIGVPHNRGKGIGSKALRYFIKDLENVYAEVYEDNPVSLDFFKKNGFTDTGKFEYEDFAGKKRKLIKLKKIVKDHRN